MPSSNLSRSIMPRLDCARWEAEPEYREVIRSMVDRQTVGGFALFEGRIETVASAIEELRARSKRPLLFAADCEYGLPMRFAGGTAFPSMMALGHADVAATYTVARSIGSEMSAIGIDWNFAPVADVNTNPDNPIINIRSFGETPEDVIVHVNAYRRGLEDEGVIACVKHFPGHGDTHTDSHIDIPSVDADRERLEKIELLPFASAIGQGIRSIMVSHVAVPGIEPDALPASLSKNVVTGLLRDEMGYDGLVVTDALDMQAITRHYDSGEAAVMCYNAGCDVLLLPEVPDEALAALEQAAADGRIESDRIDAAVARIDALIEWRNGNRSHYSSLESASKGHNVIALEAARKAIRTKGTVGKLYPPLFVLAFVDTVENPAPDEWFGYFSSWYSGEAAGAIVTPDVSDDDMTELLGAVDASSTVIALVSVRPRGFSGTVGLSEDQQSIIDRASKRQLVVINVGNPYLLGDLEPALRIDTYSSCSASLAASIESLAAQSS